MEEIVKLLREKNKTISMMESATGGAISNEITNVEGASEVFSFSAVTYSNYYKIKFGVPSEVIEKYSVYSKEVAREMSYAISKYANSDYGVGITGKLNREDPANLYGDNNVVYISIFDKGNNTYKDLTLKVKENTRYKNKLEVLNALKEMMLDILR